MGDCVAWKPEMAPQATVMNISGQIGRCVALGYKLASVSSIMGRVPVFAIVPIETPTAIRIRNIPKIG